MFPNMAEAIGAEVIKEKSAYDRSWEQMPSRLASGHVPRDSAQVTSLQQDAPGTQLLLPLKFPPQTTFPKTLEKAIYWAHPRGHDEHDILLGDGKVMNEAEFLQRHFGALKQLARSGATVNLNGLRYADGQPNVEELPCVGVPLGMS